MRILPLLLIATLALAAPAHAEGDAERDQRTADALARERIPPQLDEVQRTGYRGVFASIRAGKWTDAQLQLDAMKPGPLHAIARAELYTAKGSPKVALDPLMALLAEAPDLPQAPALARLASARGATTLPMLPVAQRLVWYDAAPIRLRARSIRSDTIAAELAAKMQPLIKEDRGAEAEALVEGRAADLTPEALTEWRQRVAWIYYVAGDDSAARRIAALAQTGTGDWAWHADWVQGLASWRQKDCRAAGAAFQSLAQRATDTELRAAGLYWASRADMACGRPDLVQGRLQSAAQFGETFYGLLSRQALGIIEVKRDAAGIVAADWRALERRPNVRVAAALVEIDEDDLASEVIKYQARIGSVVDYPAMTRLAGKLNLPQTQLWLSHNGPAGARPMVEARYPKPDWTPDGGWRVDKALVFAHTLQESKFDARVVSPAGATGLMQVKMGAATDVARARGTTIARSQLTRPSTNMEVGQTYLEQLRDAPMTGGLLPKVIAAYNAGPTPVQAWNVNTRDGGDPLLYIESIPYWETRGYVMTVLRNYWMYEAQDGKPSSSRSALSQGMWPKFPGLPGAASVRMGGPRATGGAGGN